MTAIPGRTGRFAALSYILAVSEEAVMAKTIVQMKSGQMKSGQ